MTVPLPPSTFADRHTGGRRRPDTGTLPKAHGYDGAGGLAGSAGANSIRQDKPLAPGAPSTPVLAFPACVPALSRLPPPTRSSRAPRTPPK